MDELSPASGSPPLSPLPEGLNDPGDTNAPLYQDEDPPAAPVADPTAEMDDLSDNDSVLSEVDEAQFEDFDPTNIAIEDRPAIAVDEDNVKLLGRHKRKRDGDDGEAVKKKKKEGKREKPKKSRKKRDSDEDDFSGGQELEGKRKRKPKAITEDGASRKEKVRPPRKATPENEEALDPEERKTSQASLDVLARKADDSLTGRRRALDRAMDAALKNPTRRRRKADGIVSPSKYLSVRAHPSNKSSGYHQSDRRGNHRPPQPYGRRCRDGRSRPQRKTPQTSHVQASSPPRSHLPPQPQQPRSRIRHRRPGEQPTRERPLLPRTPIRWLAARLQHPT